MIHRNKQLNAADDLDRARRMIRVADLAFGAECYEDAASSAYYAAHHAARALLFSLGLEVRSHEALRVLLAQHFEKTGLLPRGTVKKLGDAFDARMKATYGVGVHFTRDQAAAWLAWSRQFLENAADHLADFLAAPPGPSSAREATTPYRKSRRPKAARPPTTNSRRNPGSKSQKPIQQRAAKSQQP
ncbi:MAG: HEPN domain-containing protein [Deltaproteobacteria bacterium]|nr:HEPN domain-containing protein [Deltaproteobacteria bacterium]